MQEGNLSSTIDTIIATSDTHTHTHTATAVHNVQPSLRFHVMCLAILLETETPQCDHIFHNWISYSVEWLQSICTTTASQRYCSLRHRLNSTLCVWKFLARKWYKKCQRVLKLYSLAWEDYALIPRLSWHFPTPKWDKNLSSTAYCPH